MPREIPMIRPLRPVAALIAALLLVAALPGCQTSRNLVRQLTVPATPAQPPPSASGAHEDLALVGHALDAPAAGQAGLLAAAEQAYRITPGPRQTLRLALLLSATPDPGTNLQRAQGLLQGLLSDPQPPLPGGERNLARLALVLITRQLTLHTEMRTLRQTGAQQVADLQHRLRSAAQHNASLRTQLDEARAKLAAITNIEKSMNEGKLGTEGPP